MLNHLYFVRHGENYANLTKEFSFKKVDYSLTPKGRLQAEQTADYFRDRALDAIFSSPLKRAHETAQIIAAAKAMPVQVEEFLREVNVGDLELVPPSAETWDLHMQIIRGWRNGNSERRFPGGENYPELWARFRQGLTQILSGRSGQNLLIVSHGGILALTLHDLCADFDTSELRKKENANCSISEFEIGLVDGRLYAKPLAFACFDHLCGEAAEIVSGIPDENTFKKK